MMTDSTFMCCAYCWKNELSWDSILSYKCQMCQKRVHYGCIKSPQPSSFLDDTFYTYKCMACGEDSKEEFERSNISWLNVVVLALYNLHKSCQGFCGFYHWRSHIGAFIGRHWSAFFGMGRKKTTLWLGTVAGTLSSGCPQYFESGANAVEQGYWRLTQLVPPLPQRDNRVQREKKRKASETPVYLDLGQRRCRKSKESSLKAAIELKEKRSQTLENKVMKKLKFVDQCKDQVGSSLACCESSPDTNLTKKRSKGKAKLKKTKNSGLPTDFPHALKTGLACTSSDGLPDFQDNVNIAPSSAQIQSFEDCFGPREVAELDNVGSLVEIKLEDESDFEIYVDVGPISEDFSDLPDLRPSSPDINMMLNPDSAGPMETRGKSPVSQGTLPLIKVKQEPVSDAESEGQSEREIDENSEDEQEEEEEDEEDDDEEDEDEEEAGSHHEDEATQTERRVKSETKKIKRGRPRKRRREDDAPPPSPPPRLERISLFEEGELLQHLSQLAEKQPLKSDLAQLRRKLICNQTNREFGLPVFDLEREVAQFNQQGTSLSGQTRLGESMLKVLTQSDHSKETRDLDRFMMLSTKKCVESRQYTRFYQRLVGLQDWDLKPVVSPYTTRLLLPFIWRNYHPSRKPLKLRLLEEIQAYLHKHNTSWSPPPSPPIDFCYVRLEHIPSVNALCREFFWPGIDMSECLQYPDFSCVVLFRKIVIAFAFMVPDRGYNEAYISFIFTHPEWRGAGIATFMLYHLIQTCMGKDVILHVSVTNPAMLLYQKFGFKAEELNINFYHKYFPLNAPDSVHACLMRLSR